MIRVLAQVRFAPIFSIEKPEFVAPLQEAVRPDYPVLRPDHQVHAPSEQGLRAGRIWRFHDATGAWTFTLGSDFLALDTARYVSRNDFLGRWQHALNALQEHIAPVMIDRVGIRYVDRLQGKDLPDSLRALLRPELLGVMATPLADGLRHAVWDNLFELPEERAQLRTRWGWIPAQSTIDPTTIEPIGEPSWLLDLDAFRLETQSFEPDAVVQLTRALAQRVYAFFRWAVTREFLLRYGGRP